MHADNRQAAILLVILTLVFCCACPTEVTKTPIGAGGTAPVASSGSTGDADGDVFIELKQGSGINPQEQRWIERDCVWTFEIKFVDSTVEEGAAGVGNQVGSTIGPHPCEVGPGSVGAKYTMYESELPSGAKSFTVTFYCNGGKVEKRRIALD